MPDPVPATSQAPGGDDAEEALRRMIVLTGLLTASGLTARLNHTGDIPDITARLTRPGGKDIQIIIDDDGYIEIRYWASPHDSPEQITTTLTRVLRAIR
jgi:hypothetical protein